MGTVRRVSLRVRRLIAAARLSLPVLAIVAIMAGGIATGVVFQHMTAAAASTPWAGILERVNIYGTMLWVLALGVTLLRARMGERAAGSAATPVIVGPAISMLSLR